jgi:hypothetical protein
MFWASDEDESALSPVAIELALSPDPVLRAKQVLNTLLAGPASSDLRTLPPDAALLAFYLLPDGTGIADFSEALATSTPSGIESEPAGRRFDRANTRSQCAAGEANQNSDSRTGSGNARRTLDLTQMFIVKTKRPQPFSLSVTVPVKPSAAAGATPASPPPAAKGKEPRR